ncbi:MAG: hypothetical protein ACFNTA_10610 [Campylobacter sp.]|uniref:hypothetical protein n=1 Tax=Campylobacter sp. TaxID=205 RepID=UPI0036101CDB
MIEPKPDLAALATAVNLSPVSPSNEKRKFATDFYGKFDGEPFKTAAENVKFERETRAKTPASPQIKFNLNTNLNRVKNLTNQAARRANQTRVNSARSGASKQTSNLASNLTKRH